MPLPRLRRVARSRSRDDDDWGTSSPAAIMHPPSPSTSTPGVASNSVAASPSLVVSRGGVIIEGDNEAGGLTSSSSTTNRAMTDQGNANNEEDRGGGMAGRKVNPLSIPNSNNNHGEERSIRAAFAKLQQQELKSYTNTFSPRCVISFYFSVAVLFLPLGSAIVAGTANLHFHGPIQYDNKTEIGEIKYISVRPKYRIRSPSYFYYVLDNYHQNARDYVKSRSDVMNWGDVPSVYMDIENCGRWLCPVGGDKCLRLPSGALNKNGFVYPCGLTARSFFNDEFNVCHNYDRTTNSGCNSVKWSDGNEIAWWTDNKYKFKNGTAPQFTTKRNPDIYNKTANELLDDPHFVVWMRLSAFPKFYKLYAVIKEDLLPDQTYYVRIGNFYNVSQFAGKKYFVITETRWFGDSNAFLGTAFLAVGVASLCIAIFLLSKHMSSSSSPTHIDPAILLREHLASFENDPTVLSPIPMASTPASTPSRQPLHLS